MAQQKYKPSKSRSRKRRAHYLRVEKPNLAPCFNCGSLKLPHKYVPNVVFIMVKKLFLEN